MGVSTGLRFIIPVSSRILRAYFPRHHQTILAWIVSLLYQGNTSSVQDLYFRTFEQDIVLVTLLITMCDNNIVHIKMRQIHP